MWQWHVEPQISIGKENKYETNTSACYTAIISGKINSVDIVKTVRWQWHVKPQISIGKENKYETNTSACYTGISSGKINSVDICEDGRWQWHVEPQISSAMKINMRQIQVRVLQE